MATMKTEGGERYPASAYLITEKPDVVGTWHLRYRDAEGKVDPRLLGACHAALLSPGGYRGNRYAGPDKQKAISRLKALYKQAGLDWPEDGKAGMSAAAGQGAGFALSGVVRREDGYVIRRGKLFEGGDYPDKSIWLTPDDLAAAVANFTAPVPVDLEHQSTVLDNQLGEVRSITVGEDGWSLFGEVALPEWLDAALEASGRKVSAMWDRATKRLTGLALVNHPRIADAALMAAFAASGAAGTGTGTESGRHDTYDGQRTMQAIHDIAAKSGALCTTDNPNGTQRYSSSYFVSAHERTAMQAVHDAATEHGAKCSEMGAQSTYAAAFAALFAGQRHSASDAKDIQAIHDLATKQGADCAPATAGMSSGPPSPGVGAAGAGPSGAGRRGRSMSMLATFKNWFGAGPEVRELARNAGAEVPDEALFRVVEDEAYQARQEAQRTEADKLKAEREQALRERDAARQETIRAHAIRQQAEAAAFCDGLLTGGKLFPAEREPLIAALVQAAQDDATGAATFSGAGTGIEGKTRVDALKAIYEARPSHGLTAAQVAQAGTAGFSVLPGAGDTTQDPTQPTPDGKVVPEARLEHLRKAAGLPAKKA